MCCGEPLCVPVWVIALWPAVNVPLTIHRATSPACAHASLLASTAHKAITSTGFYPENPLPDCGTVACAGCGEILREATP